MRAPRFAAVSTLFRASVGEPVGVDRVELRSRSPENLARLEGMSASSARRSEAMEAWQ
jgi:hypothetical protein